ncbi:MAG: phosphatase PAP2 family protein [Actinomycetota bacterium]
MRTPVLDRSRIPVVVIAVAAVGVLLAPFPGESFSVVFTRLLGNFGSGIPGVSHLSDGLLWLLAAGTGLTLVWSWRAFPQRRVTIVSASLGVAVALAVSEGAKLVFGQLRPCVRWPGAGECAVSDFSLPSNHATLAFAAVWVIAVATRRSWYTALAAVVALIVSLGRVLEGVHYVHDIAAGALVGLVVPALLTAAGLAGEQVRRR